MTLLIWQRIYFLPLVFIFILNCLVNLASSDLFKPNIYDFGCKSKFAVHGADGPNANRVPMTKYSFNPDTGGCESFHYYGSLISTDWRSETLPNRYNLKSDCTLACASWGQSRRRYYETEVNKRRDQLKEEAVENSEEQRVHRPYQNRRPISGENMLMARSFSNVQHDVPVFDEEENDAEADEDVEMETYGIVPEGVLGNDNTEIDITLSDGSTARLSEMKLVVLKCGGIIPEAGGCGQMHIRFAYNKDNKNKKCKAFVFDGCYKTAGNSADILKQSFETRNSFDKIGSCNDYCRDYEKFSEFLETYVEPLPTTKEPYGQTTKYMLNDADFGGVEEPNEANESDSKEQPLIFGRSAPGFPHPANNAFETVGKSDNNPYLHKRDYYSIINSRLEHFGRGSNRPPEKMARSHGGDPSNMQQATIYREQSKVKSHWAKIMAAITDTTRCTMDVKANEKCINSHGILVGLEYPRYYFDSMKNECIAFMYKTCLKSAVGGNQFHSEAACINLCKDKGDKISRFQRKLVNDFIEGAEDEEEEETSGMLNDYIQNPDEFKSCEAPPKAMADDCHSISIHQRYSYDAENDICVKFMYSGCGKSDNFFYNMKDCQNACSISNNEEEEIQDTEEVSNLELSKRPGWGKCMANTPTPSNHEIEGKTCISNLLRVAFNRETKECELITYSGCGRTRNFFTDMDHCNRVCTAFTY